MKTRDFMLVGIAGVTGAGIVLLTDHLLSPAGAAILPPAELATPAQVQPASALDDGDLLWGFHVDGQRIRACVASTNSRTLSAPRCSDWTG